MTLEFPEVPPLAEEEFERLIRQAQSADDRGRDKARRRLVEANLRLVWHVARRFFRYDIDRDDLFQAGCVGLLQAIDGFDPDRGTRFSTFAVPHILGECRRQLRDEQMIRISRRLARLARDVRSKRAELAQQEGVEPSIQRVATALGLSVDDVTEALEATRGPTSLHDRIGSDSASPLELIDRIAGDHDPAGQAELYTLIDALPLRLRRILALRYFRDQTQSQVAAALGISQAHVSRLEQRALDHLQTAFQA